MWGSLSQDILFLLKGQEDSLVVKKKLIKLQIFN